MSEIRIKEVIEKKPFKGGLAFSRPMSVTHGAMADHQFTSSDQDGLSVRDYIAIKMISGAGITLQTDDGEFVGIPHKDIMIKKAYEMADAIIEYGEIGR